MVGPLEGVGAQVEQLRQAQLDEGLLPDVEPMPPAARGTPSSSCCSGDPATLPSSVQ